MVSTRLQTQLQPAARRTWVAPAVGLAVVLAAGALLVIQPWRRPVRSAALKPQAAALLTDARTVAAQGEYSRATQMLYQALDAQGPHPELYGRLGIAFLEWSYRDRDPMLVASAENNFFLALRMNPQDEELWRYVDEGIRRGFFYRYDWERIRRRR
ncbi:MAG: hypothetical protein HY660_09900 [Armatimonadetes bacterium]|nr:hypothetical protein [Armatimonadota bacterium]